eukprot:CAMPEP_0203667312 /NCGR_PEP_ID=MMETSP0090-20130426/4169_1 /ASSEMBLY_ACC=CAM_ASM_001088 /TAXON_ID=426623 /ORGANISM="Chaetoceros affinis, Strain CCMP159" /LENGTH=84 /DNA_ID=CAMNT_0050531433 /DNA_START=553 /DNA_END=803 /DNA_ORIENTATION=-
MKLGELVSIGNVEAYDGCEDAEVTISGNPIFFKGQIFLTELIVNVDAVEHFEMFLDQRRSGNVSELYVAKLIRKFHPVWLRGRR